MICSRSPPGALAGKYALDYGLHYGALRGVVMLNRKWYKQGHVTYGSGIDEDHYEDDQEQNQYSSDDPHLVVFPDDVFECLPGRGEPQEGCGRAAVIRTNMQ